MPMAEINYSNMSNAEIRIRMHSLEELHESKKAKAAKLLEEIIGLELSYKEASEELSKRSRGGYVSFK